jgi:hypothetical protein
LLVLVALAGGTQVLAQGTPAAAGPSLLIIDENRGGGYWNPVGLQEMLDAGFQVGMTPAGQTTDEQLKHFNVALVLAVAPNFATDLQPKLEKFMNAGGGVLIVPPANQPVMNGGLLPMLKWLKSLGATEPLQGVFDPDRRQVIDWCKWPGAPEYVWTSEIEPSPITAGVKTIWYRTGASANFEPLSAPFELDAQWTPLVRTGPDSHTVSWSESAYEPTFMTKDLQTVFGEFYTAPGRKQGRLPLLAVRPVGAGRLAVFGCFPQDWFWTPYVPALGAVTLHKGFGDRPSDGWQLLSNLYRYLGEPSQASGALGGYTTIKEQLFRAVPGPPAPYDWKNGAEGGLGASFAGADPLLRGGITPASAASATATLPAVPRGLVGAHTAYSTGQGTVAQWAAAGKAAGLDFIVVLEDLAFMNATKWEQLKADCKAASDDSFLIYPGFEYKQELGTRGYFLNRDWMWPADPTWLTRDGKRITTTHIFGENTGPLTLWLGYDQPVFNSTQYTAGFFSHGTDPTPSWGHRGYGSFAVFSRDRDQVLDSVGQSLPQFLTQQSEKLHISPMGLSLLYAPQEIPAAVKRGGPFLTLLGQKKDMGPLLDHGGAYCYNGRASGLCATTGPSILTWNSSYTVGYVVPRWNVAKREEDFFVLDNYRFRIRLAAASPLGLAEILLYDGDHSLYRRFLPGGKRQFEATLDFSNDQSRHLVMVVKDTAGGVAVSPELQTETWLNRHYLCADRCNFGVGNGGQGAWYDFPGPYTTQLGPETMCVGRWYRPIISADVLALRADLDTRFETGGGYEYMWGNPWHTYYQTWPLEQMNLHRTTYYWRGQYGGDIYFTEEYFPAGLDSIWDFPKPAQPFYPECRWPVDPAMAALPQWKLTGHTLNECNLTADVTFQQPLVEALTVTKDYTPGKASYDFRIAGQRLTGPLPEAGAPALVKEGLAPASGLYCLTGEAGKTGWSWYVTGANLTWRLRAEAGKATLQIGWPVPAKQGKKGTGYRAEIYALEGEPTEAALAGMLDPAGLQATVGTPVLGRLPYTFAASQGAARLHVTDLSSIPFEWIPLEIRGLRTDATAYYLEPGADKLRPIGVDPDGVGRVVLWRGKHNVDVFLGHPILCSDPDIHYDAVRLADGTWILDANNPTDQDRSIVFSWNPAYPGSGPLPGKLTLARGTRVQYTLKEAPHA